MDGRNRQIAAEFLEARRLLAAAPAEPRADSLGRAFDAGERAVLLDRLTNFSRATRNSLSTKLDAGVGGFDSTLLSLMRNRDSANFFFDPANIDELGDFIVDNNISYTDLQSRSNAVIDGHVFPEQSGASAFTVDLLDNINWVSPAGSDNPEFLHALNRHEWWREMVWVSAINNGDAKYANEIEYELASWSQQFPTMETPAAWSKSDRAGWLLDTGIRAEIWTWTYFGLLHNAHFSGAENALFLYKLVQTGDFLFDAAQATTDFSSNRSIVLGKGLYFLGTMFPEIDNAARWKDIGKSILFRAMDAQIYADGSHVEQSPGYAFNVSDDLIDVRQLDRQNGIAWPRDKRVKLANIVDSYWQFLSPNGRRPAVGDTYRSDARGAFLKPIVVLDGDRWPAVKPRPRDVFALGADAVQPYVTRAPFQSSLGNRGANYAMENSGNYILRSGNDDDARQLIFDAGPKGGPHGHFDLLNFELSGYGRPLISDPGAYKYDTSANRNYVISTQAHNTINVDGRNHAALEKFDEDDVLVSQFRTGANFSQITATHNAYEDLAGSPTLTRSVWFDRDDVMIVVDWAQASARHDYQVSFNLQTEGDVNNVTVDAANRTARTRYATGGNVRVTSIRGDDAETAVKGPLTFVTNSVGGDFKDDAYRFTLNQSGKHVVFATLINTYNGRSSPNISARIVGDVDGQTIKIELNKNGSTQTIDFSLPQTTPLNSIAATRGTFNDIAFDRDDRLHLAYADRDNGALMYAVRDEDGSWSTPLLIDAAASSDADGGFTYVSLAVNSEGSPAVAYFDGWNGDLLYAEISPRTSNWGVEVIDSRGSTGLYPSLAFGRDDRPAISFYNRTESALMLARSTSNGFSISAIDSAGDVGRSSSLVLDPNRTSITRWTIGYVDTSRADVKYAIEGDFDGGATANGFTSYVVDDLEEAGGYISLAYYDDPDNTARRFKPAMSYYDSGNTALKYARGGNPGSTWGARFIASPGVQGLYSNLIFENGAKANIFYFDRTLNEAVRMVQSNGVWTRFDLRAGGRELHVSVNSDGVIAYSTLDEKLGRLSVHTIP